MASKLENKAAWIKAAHGRPLEIDVGPTPDPAENEVVIKVAYAAVNPIDWKLQDYAFMPLPYPFILGTDVAGIVVQLGRNVTKFKIRQRVTGHCDSLANQKAANSGFQLYSTCPEVLVSPVPDSVPLSQAAVLPVAVSTAATCLFRILQLPLPVLRPKPIEKTILIWGGSSSVGTAAVQLAVAAGLKVIATASPTNSSYVESLGASTAFNHRDPNAVAKIVAALKPGDLVMDCIADGKTQTACATILAKIGGGKLPMVLPPEGSFPENVEVVQVSGLDPGTVAPELGEAVWHKYIPAALEAGQFQAKPDPLVIEGGLAKVQEGLDRLKRGVSAQKVVIEIEKA